MDYIIEGSNQPQWCLIPNLCPTKTHKISVHACIHAWRSYGTWLFSVIHSSSEFRKDASVLSSKASLGWRRPLTPSWFSISGARKSEQGGKWSLTPLLLFSPISSSWSRNELRASEVRRSPMSKPMKKLAVSPCSSAELEGSDVGTAILGDGFSSKSAWTRGIITLEHRTALVRMTVWGSADDFPVPEVWFFGFSTFLLGEFWPLDACNLLLKFVFQ